MKAIFTGIAAAAFGAMITTAALADGGPRSGSLKDMPVAAGGTYDWSGGYFGGHIGYGSADSKLTETLPTVGPLLPLLGIPSTLSSTHGVDGFIGGLQVGARRQFGSFVLGVELAGTGSGIKGSTGNCLGIEALAAGFGAPAGLIGSQCKTEVNWLATATGRAGFAFEKFLVYGALGFSVAGVTNTNTISVAIPRFPIALNGSQNDVLDGLAYGVGGEWAFMPGMSLAAEYLRHDLQAKSSGLLLGGILTTGTRNLDLDTFTAKLNMKF